MFVITGRVKVNSYPELAKRVEAGLAPILKRNPGFRGLHCVDAGDGVGVGIIMFESADEAAVSREDVNEWTNRNLAPLYQAEPIVSFGEVILSVRPDTPTAQPGATTRPEVRPH
jgi:hypothetical protein